MSYFSQEKRSFKTNGSLVGPGSYSPLVQNIRAHSYAPFGSLQKKQHEGEKSGKKDPLGPGSYDINRQLIKPPVSQYQNDKCIILKVNDEGCYQFKSNVRRFKTFGNESSTPGPGSYDWGNEKDKMKKRTKSVSTVVDRMKGMYKEYNINKQPTLKTQPKPEKQLEKEKIIKGLKWNLNKKDRFQEMYRQNTVEDESDSLILDNIKRERKKIKQTKQSSAFASKSVKSCFDAIIYKSNNPFKVQLRKMLGFEDDQPGPGAYYQEADQNKKKQNRFQFFGSTVNRFTSQNEENSQLGPGHYFSKEKINVKKKQIRPKAKSRENRVIYPDQNELCPGYYNTESNVYPKTFNYHHTNGQGSFGSKKPRFQEKKEKVSQKKPEYVSYITQESEQKKKRIEEEFNYRRNLMKNKKDSIFMSDTKRNCLSYQKESSPFGLYEVGVNDIGTRLRRQKDHSEQFSQCDLYSPPFMSSVDRFKQKKVTESTHKDCWCLIKQIEKRPIQHASAVFESKIQRLTFGEKARSPPVGQYNKESSFIKPSYNSKFLKNSKTHTKNKFSKKK